MDSRRRHRVDYNTRLPAIARFIESAPTDAQEEQQLSNRSQIEPGWLHRNGQVGGMVGALTAADIVAEFEQQATPVLLPSVQFRLGR